jgi:hypothetical protein
MLLCNVFTILTAFMAVANAKRSLMATSLVTCMENSQISPSYFNVTFNPDDRSLRYSLDLTTEVNGYITAIVQVYAYGFNIIEKEVNMCNLGWKQFCPIYPGNMQVESIEYIDKEYVDMIPGIAYNVPDIDAVAKVTIYERGTKKQLSCLQASFSNGKTVSQTGAKWATAVVAGLGLLLAAGLSTFGNSNAALHISANAVSLFLYFQAVVVVSMQSVDRVPPIASAWAENLAWSMGLIRVLFMQKIFRWYVQATGGDPDLYFNGTTKQILVQRAYNYLLDLHSRALELPAPQWMKRSLSFSLDSNANLIILRGIKRVGYDSKIEPTSIVVTGFTFFVICGYVLMALIFFIFQILTLLVRSQKINPNFAMHFRKSFGSVIKGSLLRYIYIGFTQLVILSLWEFTQNDSAAVIVLAVLFLLLSIGMIGYSLWRTISFGRTSIQQYNNPAALLYGDKQILEKYGFCYTMFHAEKYWFGVVMVGYGLVKAIFIGLCQNSGKTSSVAIFVFDLAYTIYLIILSPFLNKPTNIVNYCIAIVNTLNSFFFMFFSDLFGQRASVGSIMGWIFFVLNAAFSLILLLMIIVLAVLSVLSKNPDARFAPAKDDRTSFQRKDSIRKKDGSKADHEPTNELFALGAAAQDHQKNWESQMQQLNELAASENHNPLTPSLEKSTQLPSFESSSFDSLANEKEARQDETAVTKNAGESFGTRLKNLTRALSTKNKNRDGAGTRLSDTLNDDQGAFGDENELQFHESNADQLQDLPQPTSAFHRDNSNTPINQHHRDPSNSAFSAYSTNPTDEPTNTRRFV